MAQPSSRAMQPNGDAPVREDFPLRRELIVVSKREAGLRATRRGECGRRARFGHRHHLLRDGQESYFQCRQY